MEKAGFPKMIHSIGLEVHERPYLGQKSEDQLKGATMAIEPAFYLSRYGMRRLFITTEKSENSLSAIPALPCVSGEYKSPSVPGKAR